MAQRMVLLMPLMMLNSSLSFHQNNNVVAFNPKRLGSVTRINRSISVIVHVNSSSPLQGGTSLGRFRCALVHILIRGQSSIASRVNTVRVSQTVLSETL